MVFKVTNYASGHQFKVNPGETVLDAALRQGINLEYGCRGGRCGDCQGRLLEGQFGYAQQPLLLQRKSLDEDAILLCQAVPNSDLIIEAREFTTSLDLTPMRMPCKVLTKDPLCHDVMRLHLKLPETVRVPFLAGQYLDFIQDDGERRSFSIANAPHDDNTIELHIRNVVGGEFTQYIFDELKEKDILRIEIPLGNFFLREHSERPIILMGGGTGFAPLKAIVEHTRYIGSHRPIHLFWGVRAKRDLYLDSLPKTWADTLDHFAYTPVLSNPQDDDHWKGETGYVHESVLRHYPELQGFDIYMSGPPIMIDAAREAFLQHGLPPAHLYSDAFEYNSLMKRSS